MASVLASADILSCAKIQWKAKDELRNSTEPNKEPAELIYECIKELQDKGFLIQLKSSGPSLGDEMY